MWTRKCSQCIALLSWDCRKGGIWLEMSKKWQQKQSILLLQLEGRSRYEKSKDCDGEGGKKKGTFVFGGTRRFKNQKLLLDGVLCSSQEIFSRGFNEKRMSGCQRERIVSFQKGAEKKPLWSEIIHGVTVTPWQYYLSALTSWLEMAFCFVQGTLE